MRAEGDGVWQPLPTRRGAATALYRTLLHPDAERSYAELFVFALDTTQLEIHAVAGSVEPAGPERGEAKARRAGLVPEEARGRLLAAFNGGFKAEHGHYGMKTDRVEWLAPKKGSCTIAADAAGRISIAPWVTVSARSDWTWWRQTPACMAVDGEMHAGLSQQGAKGWGATLDGDTVIRRSALGLTRDGQFLLVGISNATTAAALASGMLHAGAWQLAQLDVNFSYPRFLTYRDSTVTRSGLVAEGAVEGLLYGEEEFVGRPSSRDFFYVTLEGEKER